MIGRITLLAASFAVAGPALAQDEQLVLPSRDVAVEYRTNFMSTGLSADPDTRVVARFESRTGRIRVDGPDGRFYAILDIDAERMIMVMPEGRVYMEQPADPD